MVLMMLRGSGGLEMAVIFGVDELQDQRPASHNVTASRQKVSTYDVLQYARFPCTLRSYHY
jgi:hypothetical protein